MNYHVVAEQTFEDYPRLYRSDVVQSPSLVWSGAAWRGDMALGQVVFWTRERPAMDVAVTVGDFSKPDGSVLPDVQFLILQLTQWTSGAGH